MHVRWSFILTSYKLDRELTPYKMVNHKLNQFLTLIVPYTWVCYYAPLLFVCAHIEIYLSLDRQFNQSKNTIILSYSCKKYCYLNVFYFACIVFFSFYIILNVWLSSMFGNFENICLLLIMCINNYQSKLHKICNHLSYIFVIIFSFVNNL